MRKEVDVLVDGTARLTGALSFLVWIEKGRVWVCFVPMTREPSTCHIAGTPPQDCPYK